VETFGSRRPVFEPEHIKRIGQRILNWFKGIDRQDTQQGQLYIYSPIFLTVHNRFFLFINRLIFLCTINRLIKKLGMYNPILFFYIPPPTGTMKRLKAKAIIYHCIDEWTTYPGGKNKIFMEAEQDLLKNADLVIAASNFLYESKKAIARKACKVYHGVDYGHFTKQFAKEEPLPEDIKNIPRPIIAIVGSFVYWMDFDLIKLIAQKHKEWSIVSIGPIDSDVDIKDLVDMGNIYFLRQKDYSQLPNYYMAIDVFIVPFLLNEHIKFCAPTRLYEHLSSGKPVITTDFSAAHEVGEGLIGIASSKDDFVNRVELVLKEDGVAFIERRKALAKLNTWSSKANQISNMIKEVMRNVV
jgi:glycosyltransferase involved in cell wall biosynthesis